MKKDNNSRIESELEVGSYIQNLRYALDHGAIVTFQVHRLVEEHKDEKYTNQYTVSTLFPNENPVEAIKKELRTLTIQDYMETVKDIRFPNRSEMRVFGKTYNLTADVYIKIRVELLGHYGNITTFVMSFHFAETPFTPDVFPYRK